jgi:hypothetical protein
MWSEYGQGCYWIYLKVPSANESAQFEKDARYTRAFSRRLIPSMSSGTGKPSRTASGANAHRSDEVLS